MTKYCGIRSKVHIELIESDLNYSLPAPTVVHTRVKGITETAKKKISFERFVSVLRTVDTVKAKMRAIRSYNHKLFTVDITKQCFGSFDDKRFLTVNSAGLAICSRPYFSKYNTINAVCMHTPECILPPLPLYV